MSDWAKEADAAEQHEREREDALCDERKDRELFRDERQCPPTRRTIPVESGERQGAGRE